MLDFEGLEGPEISLFPHFVQCIFAEGFFSIFYPFWEILATNWGPQACQPAGLVSLFGSPWRLSRSKVFCRNLLMLKSLKMCPQWPQEYSKWLQRHSKWAPKYCFFVFSRNLVFEQHSYENAWLLRFGGSRNLTFSSLFSNYFPRGFFLIFDSFLMTLTPKWAFSFH